MVLLLNKNKDYDNEAYGNDKHYTEHNTRWNNPTNVIVYMHFTAHLLVYL